MMGDPTEPDALPEVPEKKARSEARFGILAAAVLTVVFVVAGLVLPLPLDVGNPMDAWAALFYFIAYPAVYVPAGLGAFAPSEHTCQTEPLTLTPTGT